MSDQFSVESKRNAVLGESELIPVLKGDSFGEPFLVDFGDTAQHFDTITGGTVDGVEVLQLGVRGRGVAVPSPDGDIVIHLKHRWKILVHDSQVWQGDDEYSYLQITTDTWEKQ